ncbi:MAG: protease inhibitor I42 family protein [Treponema sp.]|nr:protease inhibitor I42 family protein [Treponema sp.]
MKKSVISVLVFCILGFFTGCITNKGFKSQSKSIELRGNPTTGYSWFYKISDENIISVSEEIEYLGDDRMVGAPSLFHYTIYSEQPGSVEITFEYKRPWEDKPAEETRIFDVVVKENGTLELDER